MKIKSVFSKKFERYGKVLRGYDVGELLKKLDATTEKSNIQDFDNDYRDILRAFYPHIVLDESGDELSLELQEIEENLFNCLIKHDNSKYFRNFSLNNAFLVDRESEYYNIKRNAQIKRHSKVALYEYLVKLTGQELPYGH